MPGLGVTCDYCHSIREVTVDEKNPKAVVEFGSVRSGPSKDSVSPAHGTTYSSVHVSALLCAVCHEYKNSLGFPVVTYTEWKESPSGKGDLECQQCHMELVKGSVVDPRVKRESSHLVNLHAMPGSHSSFASSRQSRFARQCRKIAAAGKTIPTSPLERPASAIPTQATSIQRRRPVPGTRRGQEERAHRDGGPGREPHVERDHAAQAQEIGALELLIDTLMRSKTSLLPTLIHVITKKGKGYEFSEKDPFMFHGIGPFKLETGAPATGAGLTYSEVFGDTLTELAKTDEKIIAITAAMKEGTGLEHFARKYPERFYDVGIAEPHAVTFAAGLSTQGLKPVVAIDSTFLQRAYDEIVHDVCLQNLHVVFAIDRAGLVGEDGPTHNGLFDLSFLRHISLEMHYLDYKLLEAVCLYGTILCNMHRCFL